MWRVLAIAIALIIGGYFWSQRGPDLSPDPASPGGFYSVLMPSGAPPGTVMIFAPRNCPSAAAQRARSLAKSLDNAGVPNQILDNLSLRIDNPTTEDEAKIKRMDHLLNNGDIPHVFVNGMAKSNPSADDVKAEYYRTKS